MQERRSDLLQEQLSHCTGELWSDLLWFHRNVQLWSLASLVRSDGTSQQLTQSGLSGTVFSHHDNDLTVGELSSLHSELEISLGLNHGWVRKGVCLIHNHLVGSISESKLQRLGSEPQVFCWNVTVKEDVNTFSDRCWKSHHTVHGWNTVKNANKVRQVIQHR
ncbi:hypothetical protein OGAPHI_003264 [Ogataea philodendri]|uniref:Uncharacterized protein n=1 Tax=Ogataea philodendri TaxID=1378263 RepID=A0A9P8T678_9ASCO|nr:uncharacterized protein OGAPHI_003264 [Ogataea philodendri]KAH3666815.1 hypothetical protein OGAPHI_003264 [Ogataea philodendri]